MRLTKAHEELTNGIGKCSVPMWCGGAPAGFCDERAFGVRPTCRMYRDAWGREHRMDGKYDGYMSGLACPAHGGPPCPGIEIEPGVWSGCDQSGGDCPTCGR